MGQNAPFLAASVAAYHCSAHSPSIKLYMSDGQTRRQRRLELRDLNSRAWDGENVFEAPLSYDTSLKKNTAFINRCRVNLQEGSQATLLREVATLSLEKYFSEILAAICKGLVKCKSSSELFVGVEVCSALHQRFVATFSSQLLSLFLQGIQNPSRAALDSLSSEARIREDKSRLDRHLAILKVLIELYLVDIFRSTNDVTAEGLPVPRWVNKSPITNPVLGALNEVLNYDLSDFSAGPIAVSIVRKYGPLLTGTSNIKVLPPDTCEQFSTLLRNFTEDMIAEMRTLATSARSLERRINATIMRRGKANEETITRRQSILVKYEVIKGNCAELCELLDIPMPDFKLGSEVENGALISLGPSTVGDGGVWDDEEQRNFYEDLVNLGPDKDSEQDQGERNAEELEEEEFAEEDKMFEELENLQEAESDDVSESEEEDEQRKKKKQPPASAAKPDEATEPQDESPRMRVKELLLGLSVLTSKDGVDSLAVRFAELNSHVARKLLLETMLNIPVAEQHQLPFYVRFLATVNPICPDVTEKVIANLTQFFSYLQAKRTVRALGSRRLFNIRFLAELTKFGLLTKFQIFHKLKTMIQRLDTTNIENMFVLFESCGRFLLRKPQFHELMVKSLEVLEARKNKVNLSADDKAMIKAAVTYVTPPSRGGAVVPAKQRSLAEQYIRHLIYHELAADCHNAPLVLNQLRRLNWKDHSTLRALTKVFTKVWKARYSHVAVLANFVSQLSVYHPILKVRVADGLLEFIKYGLEINNFEAGQQRITQVKYLAALTREGVISPDVVFDTAFSIMMYGHPNGGRPQRGEYCPLDPPDDFFRVRLVCSLLESGDMVATLQAHNAKRFAMLIAFLQYYILTKDPLSMDVDFQVRDTLHLIDPAMQLYTNPLAASHNLKRAIDRFNGRPVADEPVSESAYKSVNNENRNGTRQEIQVQETEAERIAREKHRAEKERLRAVMQNTRATNQFEQDFRRIIMDSSRPAAERRVDAFDEPVPSFEQSQSSVPRRVDGAVKYMIMTKKNNRSHVQPMSIPSSVGFVRNVENEKLRIIKEKERVREYILRYNYVTEEDDEEENEELLERIVQPDLPSTRYSRLKFRKGPASQIQKPKQAIQQLAEPASEEM